MHGPPHLPCMRVESFENRSFLLVVALVTLAFIWTLAGFLLPVFWAVVLAILFAPLFRRLRLLFGGRGTPASLVTLLVIFLLIVVPVVGLGLAVTNEAVGLYGRFCIGRDRRHGAGAAGRADAAAA